MEEAYLNKKEAEALGIPHQRLYDHVLMGHIRTIGAPYKRRFNKEDILRCISGGAVVVAPVVKRPVKDRNRDHGSSFEAAYNAYIRKRYE